MQQKSKIVSFLGRRKVPIVFGIAIFTVVFLIVRAKYFYRSDFLRPVQVGQGTMRKVAEVHIKETSIWSFFAGSSDDSKQVEDAEAKRKRIWDEWMDRNPELTSIGNIWDNCDNKTQTKIGKIVLEPNKDQGVHVTTYINVTFNYTVTAAKSHFVVEYKGTRIYDNIYDMCVTAPKLDTPYHCPIMKGQFIRVRDVANMPSYIPKGTYKISAETWDQDGHTISCVEAEFKTGEEEE